ncbi:RibD family protein [Gloeothece verrucosa]|uniref:Bifunctional deaminase-reductase domain protein n=1 Tax=Gloeothece verrucosa (strain PCC 7822) TaxID=497965 RepID=E0UK60_GLOV7|nr:RibD family protein [Gloeothece verrucosa]ADN15822.1 bifunctional deaminase-reductase domain protein [Gloeothece verrucosa PCC 7822]
MKRPHTLVVLAMTADGKIADKHSSAARFGSDADKNHLETQIAQVDAVLFGAGTLRAYHTSFPISNPELLQWRKQQHKPPQPVHIVCSASGNLNPEMRFFRQSLPRWLLTTHRGENTWQQTNSEGFERILKADDLDNRINWLKAFEQFTTLGLEKLAILGGGGLVASLLEAALIDEFYLTLCPLLLGGTDAPTPVEGLGFSQQQAQELELLSVKQIEGEIFLHYRLHH